MRIPSIILVVISTLVLVLGCTPGAQAPVATTVPSAGKGVTAGQEGWQQEWERTTSEARKEGTVVLAGNIGPAQVVIQNVMKDKYGVNAEFVIGRGAEVAAKIDREQGAGLFLIDAIFSTTMNILTVLKPQGRVATMDTALILPEVKDPKAWYRGEVPWVDKEHRYHVAFSAEPTHGIFVNTTMVNPSDLKSYRDLLDPKWKGKIMINDPTVSGSGNAWFTPLAQELGVQYFKDLVKQEPVMMRDERLLAEWLAKGKYPVLLGCDAKTIAEFIKAGAPVSLAVLKEGAYVTQANGAVSIATKAAHPNAAKVVVNWAMSKEGGTMISQALLGQSARVDVPTDFLPPFLVRRPDIKYNDAITEDYQFLKTDYINIAKDIFDPYMKK